MLKPLEPLLLVCLACLCLLTRGQDWRQQPQCPVKDYQYTPPSMVDRGTLGALLDTARVTREAIVSNDLPYEDMRREISEVYNRSGLSVEPFVSLWIQYSENYLYLSSFVLFVGVVFPLVVVGLWAFWECCREADREQDDQDDRRHRTVRSQVLTWSLGVIIFLLLLLLCVFLGLLLAGNSLLSSGVRSGGVAVGVVLPELARVRDNTFEQVEHLLVDEYNQLLLGVEMNVLSFVGPKVAAAVSNVTQDDSDMFQANLLQEVQLAHSLHNHTESLLASLSGPHLQTLLLALNASLADLLTSCTAMRAPPNSSVGVACRNVTSINTDTFYPRIHGDVEGGSLLLAELNHLLYIKPEANTYNTYLNATLVTYLTVSTHNTTTDHIGTSSSFGRSIENFLQEAVGYYNSTLTFDLPNSQVQLDEYLGPRYLNNWEVIRYACTLTFALFVLLLGVCLLVPIGRGLLTTVYSAEDDLSHLETAHQAGTTLKKVTFVLVGVCVVSAVGFGVFLILGGVLGRSCGRHGNFSSILDNVVDHSDSWDGGYPLGYWIVGNASFPLTVGGVVNSCRGNLSLYESLQLSVRLDLSSISFSDQAQSMYRDAMRGIASTLPLYTPLTPSQASLFTLLHNTSSLPIHWAQPLVPDDIFTPQFIGFSQLQQIINSTESAVLEMSFDVDNVSNESLSAILSSTERALTDLIAHITEHVIPSVNESAARLEECLALSKAGHVITESEVLAVSVVENSTTEARRELSVALQNITQQLLDYSSSSQHSLHCHTGSCLPLASLFDQFATAFCTELVPGVDIYWTTLLAILTLSLLILPLSLFLASRFIDPDLKESMAKKFHFWGSVLEQLQALSWLFLSLGIALWFVVTVATDEFFLTKFCDAADSICCVQCVWGMGVVFLLLAAIVGGASRIYQCVIIHRITQCPHAKVKRFWVDRKKAIQFYTQLLILLLQDVPFLILAGVYTTRPNTLTLAALFTIITSLTGILVYILYLVLERGSILAYCTWLKKALTINGCAKKATLEVTSPEGLGNGHANGGIPMMNRRRPRGRYGSSESDQSDDSQGTTQQDGDWQYATTRLSNIPEQPEGLEMIRRAPLNLSPPSPPRGYPLPSSPPGRPLVRVVPHLEDSGSYSELSQAQASASVMLDHLDPSDESALALRREAAIQQPMVGGVEIAPRGFATPTSSDCGSIYTMSEYPGYFSSQPADDDYRDEYSDSDLSQLHSQHGGRRTLQLGRLIGEVSMDV